MPSTTIGIIGIILGFYGDNGKENGNYYIELIYIYTYTTRLGCFLGGLHEPRFRV